MATPLQMRVPLKDATDDTRAKLIELAEKFVDEPGRPALDGETTLHDWLDAGIRFFRPFTCGTCGRMWDFDTPASRCPWEYDHEPEDTRQVWTVFGIYTDEYDDNGNVLIPLGYVRGQHQVLGDTGVYEMWATSVRTDYEDDVFATAKAVMREKNDDDEEDEG